MPLETMEALARVPDRAWSNKMLRRLGECLRDGRDVPRDHPPYEDVMIWYDDLAAAVNADIRSFDWDSLLVGRRAPEITSRAKTIDTLRDKLRRDRSTPLPSIQDVAGVRFECEMTLEEQDIVASAITNAFGCPPGSIHDLRDGGHSGYRAVHVWLRLPQGRVEVQIRTHLQSEWANAYESLADWLGRDIRYGKFPERAAHASIVKGIQSLSLQEGVALEERRQNLSTLVRDTDLLQQLLDPSSFGDTPQGKDRLQRLDQNRRALSELDTDARERERAYTERLRELEKMFVDAKKMEG